MRRAQGPGCHRLGVESRKPASVVQAVEGAHFFAQPVFVFIHRENTFGLAGYFAAEVSEGQARRFAPESSKFVGTACHLSEQVCL